MEHQIITRQRMVPAQLPRRRRGKRQVFVLEEGKFINFDGEGGALLVTRERISDAIELLVALLDVCQPDQDATPEHDAGVEDGAFDGNGDEQDGTSAEDEFGAHLALCADGPGCPISDPGGTDGGDI